MHVAPTGGSSDLRGHHIQRGSQTTSVGEVAAPDAETTESPEAGNSKAARQIEHMLAHGTFKRTEGELEHRLNFAGIADEGAAGIYAAREDFLSTIENLQAQYAADPHPGAHGHFRRDAMRALNDLRASIREAIHEPEPAPELSAEPDTTIGDPAAVAQPEPATEPAEATAPSGATETLVVDLTDEPVIEVMPAADTEALLLEGILASIQSEALLYDETS